jgi:hypothetical protein
MTNIPQSIQNSTVVQVSDRTPHMFQHGDESDTAKITVSRDPRWKSRSGGGYQSNGLGARRSNMSYVPGLGSTWTDIRDALLAKGTAMVTGSAAPPSSVQVQAPAAIAPQTVTQAQQVTYAAPSSSMPKWLLPAGIAAAAAVAFFALSKKKK